MDNTTYIHRHLLYENQVYRFNLDYVEVAEQTNGWILLFLNPLWLSDQVRWENSLPEWCYDLSDNFFDGFDHDGLGWHILNNSVVDWDVFARHIKKMPYKDFLQTIYWKLVRQEVIKQAHNSCEWCLCDEEQAQMHVHHNTYIHHGYEFFFIEDLTYLCDWCHGQRHQWIKLGNKDSLSVRNHKTSSKIIELKFLENQPLK